MPLPRAQRDTVNPTFAPLLVDSRRSPPEISGASPGSGAGDPPAADSQLKAEFLENLKRQLMRSACTCSECQQESIRGHYERLMENSQRDSAHESGKPMRRQRP